MGPLIFRWVTPWKYSKKNVHIKNNKLLMHKKQKPHFPAFGLNLISTQHLSGSCLWVFYVWLHKMHLNSIQSVDLTNKTINSNSVLKAFTATLSWLAGRFIVSQQQRGHNTIRGRAWTSASTAFATDASLRMTIGSGKQQRGSHLFELHR